MKSTFNHDNWQQALIETNLLIIGFNAWNGYLKAERGVIVCSTNSPLVDRLGETFKTHFVPRPRLAAFLNAWLATPDTVILQGHHMSGHILDAVDNYNLEQDVILLLESGMRVSFFSLKNLPITPPECYQRVKQAWSEFQSSDGNNFARFPSISLTPEPVDPIGRLDATNIYNLAGKHVNNGIVISDDEFIPSSWGTPFDLENLVNEPSVIAGEIDLNQINFVRIVDIPGNGSFLDSEGRPIYDPWQTPIPGSGGFDLEAIGAINTNTVPEPASMLGILLSGIFGISLRVRHKKESVLR